MFYGIYGDSDGDSPEDIGEASWLMARTCFPDEDLNGNNGHDALDVTCELWHIRMICVVCHDLLTVLPDIVFVGKESILSDSAMNSKYITDFTQLRSVGDKLMTALEKNLKNTSRSHNEHF
jgi:chitosanase